MSFTCKLVVLGFFSHRQKHEKGYTVCGMAWHPSGGQIAYTDTEGCLGLLDGLATASAAAAQPTKSLKVSRVDSFSCMKIEPKHGVERSGWGWAQPRTEALEYASPYTLICRYSVD